MGESNAAHFLWLSGAIRENLAVLKDLPRNSVVFAIGEQRATPPLEELTGTLGSGTTVRLFDLYPNNASVERLDVNELSSLPAGAADVITLIRTSVFIRDPKHVISGFHRILRPGGVVVVDWLHGTSDAPVLDLGQPYSATYLDGELLRLPAFAAFLRHVAQPPRVAHAVRVLLRRVRHPHLPPVPFLLRGRRVTLAEYPTVLSRVLHEAGKWLITPHDLAPHFRVRARDARYFYPETRTFACWALTILERC